MKYFSEKDIIPILNTLEKQYKNILFEIWALNYHMNSQRSEVLLMTPNERKFWIDELIKQREKENQEIKNVNK